MSEKVWFITGCSSGFGKCIAQAALRRGDVVIATARTMASLDDLRAKGAQTYELDVTWPDEKLSSVVSAAIAKTNRIDILVNNAGYILTGGIEEARQVHSPFELKLVIESRHDNG